MRSTWSAESVLAMLAAASVEASALTLTYLAVNWLSGRLEIHLGIPSFAVAVAIGLFLARRLRRSTWERYLVAVPVTSVLVGAVGAWLAEVSAGAPADPLSLLRSSGPWLLGVAVLRGTAHAELDDEGYTVERILRIGVPGLVAFWIIGALSRLTVDPGYTAAAFTATLTFVSSALLALGLARLAELEVESIDQAARRRWLALLIGISTVLVVVGIPLARLLEVPLGTAILGATGPLAPLIIVVFSLLAVPILIIASAVSSVIGPVDFHLDLSALLNRGSGSSSPSADLTTVLAWVFVAIVIFDLVAVIVVVAAVLRRRRRRRRGSGAEVRESERVALRPILHLPRLHLRRRWKTPEDAVEAYRLALVALAGRDEGRRSGETPREHAARIRGSAVGPSVGRLAADYQLRALGGRRLTDAEERRAQGRWGRISRWAR
jgi:hypothetical protein